MVKWEYQNKPGYLENSVAREPCKQRTACTTLSQAKLFCENSMYVWETTPGKSDKYTEPAEGQKNWVVYLKRIEGDH